MNNASHRPIIHKLQQSLPAEADRASIPMAFLILHKIYARYTITAQAKVMCMGNLHTTRWLARGQWYCDYETLTLPNVKCFLRQATLAELMITALMAYGVELHHPTADNKGTSWC